MKKFVIYTAIFGDPGRFTFPEISIKRVEKFCFTDFSIRSGCHQVIPVRKGKFKENNFYDMRIKNLSPLSSVMAQRFMKIIVPDEIFDNYEYSAYVDCKRPIGIDFEWCAKLLNDDKSDFLTRKHPRRDCVYDEGPKCIDSKKAKEDEMYEQLDFYRGENYPEHNGLYFTSWLFRRHTQKLKDFSSLWWSQLERFTHRDQISLPYVEWKHNFKITQFRGPE